MTLIPVLGEAEMGDLWEVMARLVYRANSRPSKTTQRDSLSKTKAKCSNKPGVVVHSFKHRTQEIKAGRSLWVPEQPTPLQRHYVSKKEKRKKGKRKKKQLLNYSSNRTPKLYSLDHSWEIPIYVSFNQSTSVLTEQFIEHEICRATAHHDENHLLKQCFYLPIHALAASLRQRFPAPGPSPS